jgi:hypothetical protein
MSSQDNSDEALFALHRQAGALAPYPELAQE